MNTLEENQEGTYQGEQFSPGDAERVKTKTTKITVISPLLHPRYRCYSNGTETAQHLQSGKGVSTGTPGIQQADDTADYKSPKIVLYENTPANPELCAPFGVLLRLHFSSRNTRCFVHHLEISVIV